MADFNEQSWYEDGVATLGDRLEAARKAAGLSVVDLAERLGVQDTTVMAWEADAREPRANRTQMLAGMLNVSLMWLMTGRGPGLAVPSEAAGARQALAQITRLRQKMQDLNQLMVLAEHRLQAEMREMAE